MISRRPDPRTGRCRRGPGYSLVELLAAMAVFGVGMTALWRGFAVHQVLSHRGTQLAAASRIVDQTLEDLGAGSAVRRDATLVRDELPDATLEIEIEPVPGEPALERARVRLRWRSDGDREAEIESVRLFRRTAPESPR